MIRRGLIFPTFDQRATNVRPACGGPHSSYPIPNLPTSASVYPPAPGYILNKMLQKWPPTATLRPHCGHISPLHIVKKSKNRSVSILKDDIPISKNDKLTHRQCELSYCLSTFASESFTKLSPKTYQHVTTKTNLTDPNPRPPHQGINRKVFHGGGRWNHHRRL